MHPPHAPATARTSGPGRGSSRGSGICPSGSAAAGVHHPPAVEQQQVPASVISRRPEEPLLRLRPAAEPARDTPAGQTPCRRTPARTRPRDCAHCEEGGNALPVAHVHSLELDMGPASGTASHRPKVASGLGSGKERFSSVSPSAILDAHRPAVTRGSLKSPAEHGAASGPKTAGDWPTGRDTQ